MVKMFTAEDDEDKKKSTVNDTTPTPEFVAIKSPETWIMFPGKATWRHGQGHFAEYADIRHW